MSLIEMDGNKSFPAASASFSSKECERMPNAEASTKPSATTLVQQLHRIYDRRLSDGRHRFLGRCLPSLWGDIDVFS